MRKIVNFYKTQKYYLQYIKWRYRTVEGEIFVMGINAHNIKYWTLMLTGKSISHVNQGVGKVIDKGGYYNDLTLKVLKGDKTLNQNGIPLLDMPKGVRVEMPTIIFQYGLGAYDLWLLEKKKIYLDKAIKCAEWAVEHQQADGSWNTFFYIYSEHPYSAMPQGEGASLLLRIYKETNEKIWLESARKAINYMLINVNMGGTTLYDGDEVILLEYTHLPVVLNGWIFALFGLYDLSLIDKEYRDVLNKTIHTMIKELPKYDNGFWSKYDASNKIASPFYHNVHIALMEALYMITKEPIYKQYQDKFERYKKSTRNKQKAFIIKAVQKIQEK
jgi:hypothetical protein